MGFKHYVLTISLCLVEQIVEVDFYCRPARLDECIERFLKDYDLSEINYYRVCSL